MTSSKAFDRCKSCTYAQYNNCRPCVWSGETPEGYEKCREASWRCKGYRPKPGFRLVDRELVPYVYQHLSAHGAVGTTTRAFVVVTRVFFWCISLLR